MIELESYLEPSEPVIEDDLEHETPQIDTRWWLPRREGLFAGLQG
jgi:hypothetical protein